MKRVSSVECRVSSGKRFPVSGSLFPYLLAILLITFLMGCGTAKKISVKSDPITFYLVPEWKQFNIERNKLISSLPKNTFFIYDSFLPGTAISDENLVFPEQSCVKKMKGAALLFINASLGVPPLPHEWEDESRQACLVIAFIRGRLPKKSIKQAHVRFSPDAYIFMRDHYEKIGDIHSVPAYTAGTDTLFSPFTGDFPYILKIEGSKGNVSVRPVDRDGYILKTDTVTSKNISGLRMLKDLFSVSLVVKEWETPFKHTSVITVPNPFQQAATIKVDFPLNKRNRWKTAAGPSAVFLKPGEKGTLKMVFFLEKTKEYKPCPVFTYKIYVNGKKVHEEKKEVNVKFYPKPGGRSNQ